MQLKNKYKIAIVGATGEVGKQLIDILTERNIPVEELTLISSYKNVNTEIKFNNQLLKTQTIENINWEEIDVAFFSAGAEVSLRWAPKAAEKNCIVIDNTTAFRNNPEIPLIIPEINSCHIKQYKNHNIISNPNCSTIQMLMAVFPIYANFGITSIIVSTYQSVSGTGREAINELQAQNQQLLNNQPLTSKVYPEQIANNVIPHIDEILDTGFTKEELKMHKETQKILQDTSIAVDATAVRVPVSYGHSTAIHIKTKDEITTSQAIQTLNNCGLGLIIEEDNKKYYTVAKNIANKKTNKTYISRIRGSMIDSKSLNIWVCADNTRKGAALNSVQILEKLIKQEI